MIKPDVIVVNPSSVDYPLWRHTMMLVQGVVGRVIVVHYNDYKGQSYSQFVMDSMPWATHVTINQQQGDWRNNAIHAGLSKSESNWVLFMEQDFIPTRPVEFFDSLFLQADERWNFGDVAVGWWDGDEPVDRNSTMIRFHPSCLLVGRECFDPTYKNRWMPIDTIPDFGARPDLGHDHFGLYTQELLKQWSYKINTLKSFGLLPGRDWYHWAGVTHNFHLVMQGQPPCYKLDEFKRYVRLSLEAPVPQHPDFVSLCHKCLTY